MFDFSRSRVSAKAHGPLGMPFALLLAGALTRACTSDWKDGDTHGYGLLSGKTNDQGKELPLVQSIFVIDSASDSMFSPGVPDVGVHSNRQFSSKRFR